SRLYCNVKLLTRDKFTQLLTHSFTNIICIALVNKRGKRIYHVTVDQNVHLHQFGSTKTDWMIIERCVTFGNRFKAVIKIEYNFRQRHIEYHFYTVGSEIILSYNLAALFNAEGHHRTYEIGFRDNRSLDEWFFYP